MLAAPPEVKYWGEIRSKSFIHVCFNFSHYKWYQQSNNTPLLRCRQSIQSNLSAPGTSRAALHCWEPNPLAQKHLLDAELYKGALAQILSTGRKRYIADGKIFCHPSGRLSQVCADLVFKHFYEGGITCFLSIKIQKTEQKVILYHCSNFSYIATVKWQNV